MICVSSLFLQTTLRMYKSQKHRWKQHNQLKDLLESAHHQQKHGSHRILRFWPCRLRLGWSWWPGCPPGNPQGWTLPVRQRRALDQRPLQEEEVR